MTDPGRVEREHSLELSEFLSLSRLNISLFFHSLIFLSSPHLPPTHLNLDISSLRVAFVNPCLLVSVFNTGFPLYYRLNNVLWGAVLCVVECLAQSLASLHKMPAESSTCDNQKCLQICKMSPKGQNLWLRPTGLNRIELIWISRKSLAQGLNYLILEFFFPG